VQIVLKMDFIFSNLELQEKTAVKTDIPLVILIPVQCRAMLLKTTRREL